MKNNKYYYFFDLNEKLIDRYPAQISGFLQKNYGEKNFIFIYSEKYESGIPANLPIKSKYYYLPKLSRKSIEKIMQKYPPNSLTTIAQRIPDMLMLSIFNSKNIPTFIVQHGLWADQLVRIPLILLFVSKFKKFVNFLKYTNSICMINNLPFLKTLLELYQFSFLESIDVSQTKYLNIDNIRAKKSFIFDTTWDNYYIKKYGYKKEDLIYTGNPDFMILKDKVNKKKENSVCYICQTLIEDGRYLVNDFNKFLNILNDYIASEKKLYIKMHPRSRRKYYTILASNPNVIFTNDFPICQYYIGHYSGMLALARQISDNVFIWKLSNHHMPEYYNQFASIISNNKKELNKFIKGKLKNIQTNKTVNRLGKNDLENLDPIKIIGETIYMITNELNQKK